MEANIMEMTILQWHPAFFAGMKVELQWESRQLLFENEHQLGTKPKEIDVLIIKKDPDIPIRKNIGKIFRTHNIVEFKGPDDYLCIDDYYKVYAYACFYKSDTRTVDEIKIEDITISFVCRKYPKSFVRHLQKQGLRIEKKEDGIYYIKGDRFDMQLIVTSELTKQKNFWLKNLTNDIKDRETIREIIAEYRKHEQDKLYRSLMDIIVRANREMFKEENDMMCDALRELYQEEINAAAEKKAVEMAEKKAVEMAEKKAVEMAEKKVAELVEKKEAEWAQENRLQITRQEFQKSIQKLIKHLKMTAEQAMDVLEIPLEERNLYV